MRTKSVTGLIAAIEGIKLTPIATSDIDIFEGVSTPLRQSRYPRRVIFEVPPTLESLKTDATWQVQQPAYDGFKNASEMQRKGPSQRR